LYDNLESSESGRPAQAIRQAVTQECKNTTQTIIIEKTRESKVYTRTNYGSKPSRSTGGFYSNTKRTDLEDPTLNRNQLQRANKILKGC
jgi:hypothetical protein